jgi:hypothetical protein
MNDRRVEGAQIVPKDTAAGKGDPADTALRMPEGSWRTR